MQYRMNPIIAGLISKNFYDGQLIDSEETSKKILTGKEKFKNYSPLVLYHKRGKEEWNSRGSCTVSLSNHSQVKKLNWCSNILFFQTVMVCEIIEELLRTVPNRSVLVLCAYRAQLLEIQSVYKHRKLPPKFVFTTIDGSQVQLLFSFIIQRFKLLS